MLDKISNPLVDYPSLIHPLAWIGGKEYVKLGNGCIIRGHRSEMDGRLCFGRDGNNTMVIDKNILDNLTAQAKASPRQRMAMDLRNTPEDSSQRMLNALEPETVMPIHRHLESSESVVLLRGKIKWIFYDEEGNETESVVQECKDGVYKPLEPVEIMDRIKTLLKGDWAF